MSINVNYELNLDYPVSVSISVLDNDVEIASEEQYFPFDKIPNDNLLAFITTLQNSVNDYLNNLSSSPNEQRLSTLIRLMNVFKS
jgi:hypothetical protein